MDIPSLTNEAVFVLHAAVVEALRADDAAPTGHKPYEVRSGTGWRRHVAALEAELDKRQLSYTKVAWERAPSN